MVQRSAVIEWLLEGDPSIRWQVLRDLTDAPGETVAAERARVASEGWGAGLLDLQTDEGHWDDETQHGWLSTTDVLALLKELGLDPAGEPARKAIDLVNQRVRWFQLGGEPFFEGETEACLNGRILASGAYFGTRSGRLLERLLSEELEDGGWNCKAPPSTRSSFHSTICVLEGLLAYEKAYGETDAVTAARRRAEDYLVERRLLRSLTTGDVIDGRWTMFSFPSSWHYDVLRGLDYLRGAGAAPDERLSEAIEILESKRQPDGSWPLDLVHAEATNRIPVGIETEVGKASRWNTLRAMRVLDWYYR
jgi:hypothetical protein